MEKIKKIFIVADESDGNSIKELLRNSYTAITSKGMEGIDSIREEKPDIILVDSSVHNLDPEEFLMMLKGNEEIRRIPTVLIYSEESDAFKGNEDIVSFVRKPYTKDELLKGIFRAGIVSSNIRDRKNILIVDDDSAIRNEIREVMLNLGYLTSEAKSGMEMLSKVNLELPDLIILDIMLPDIDGFKMLNQLKVNVRTKHIPVILLSGLEKAEEKAKGLRLGASDYMTKPFAPVELSARVEMVLERTEAEYSTSPSTKLPGNLSIEKAITRRIVEKLPFAVCYCDLDNFKAYNDCYGFSRGDGVIRLTAQIIMAAMKELGNNDDFLGHIGGDDFILITTPDRVDDITNRIIETLDRIIPFYYDKDTREKGYIEELDRQGRMNKFPIMSISIAVVTNLHRQIKHIGEVSDIAAELKRLAKNKQGSVVIKDQRKEYVKVVKSGEGENR